jgi:hypothetical protein
MTRDDYSNKQFILSCESQNIDIADAITKCFPYSVSRELEPIEPGGDHRFENFWRSAVEDLSVMGRDRLFCPVQIALLQPLYLPGQLKRAPATV